jgi:hypothetical protein
MKYKHWILFNVILCQEQIKLLISGVSGMVDRFTSTQTITT